ncbi:recombinase family protein, partial [Pseudochelatococcus sp. B33]
AGKSANKLPVRPDQWQKRRFLHPRTKMPKAAIYARYSSDLQNLQSIDDQFRLCRNLAERERWDIIAAYQDEAASGASIRGRAGMFRLLDDARAGRFDIVRADGLPARRAGQFR